MSRLHWRAMIAIGQQNIAQHLQPLLAEDAADQGHASGVTAGMIETCNEPAPTGSKPTTNTIGMVAVAALAARAAGGA